MRGGHYLQANGYQLVTLEQRSDHILAVPASPLGKMELFTAPPT